MKIIFFKTKKCGPCKMMSEIIEDLQKERKIDIEELYIDSSREILHYAKGLGVNNIPTLMRLDEEGKVLDVLSGFRPKNDVQNFL